MVAQPGRLWYNVFLCMGSTLLRVNFNVLVASWYPESGSCNDGWACPERTVLCCLSLPFTQTWTPFSPAFYCCLICKSDYLSKFASFLLLAVVKAKKNQPKPVGFFHSQVLGDQTCALPLEHVIPEQTATDWISYLNSLQVQSSSTTTYTTFNSNPNFGIKPYFITDQIKLSRKSFLSNKKDAIQSPVFQALH